MSSHVVGVSCQCEKVYGAPFLRARGGVSNALAYIWRVGVHYLPPSFVSTYFLVGMRKTTHVFDCGVMESHRSTWAARGGRDLLISLVARLPWGEGREVREEVIIENEDCSLW